MKFIKQFNELNKHDAPIAGGKGASLGEMYSAGIPVPDGFVILADTFEHFLKTNGLSKKINTIIDNANVDDTESVQKISDDIKSLIMDGKVPKEVSIKINECFSELNSKFVAVRSSATAEDSASAAWAGQLDSFLNTTESTLINNVKECWASLFTPRAIFYRFEQKLHKQKISVAVVVQKMVDSDVSGIAFSVHPVTQDHNQMIIEAGYGLGEAIVSGQITPDSYVVTKDFVITEKNVGMQSKKLIRASDGGNEWVECVSEKQKLDDNMVIDVGKMIAHIEEHYGFPVDVEWAIEKNKLYIVQSRPITTLDATQKKKLKFTIKRNVAPLVADLWISAYSENKNYKAVYKFDFHTRCGFFKDGSCYYGPEASDFGKQLLDFDDDERGYINKVFNHIYSLGDELLSFSEDIRETNWSNIKMPKLLVTLRNFFDDYERFSISLMGFQLQEDIEKRLKEMLSDSKNISEDLATLTFPIKENVAIEEQISLLKIRLSINHTPKNISDLEIPVKKMITKHVRDFGWINTRGGVGDCWTKDDVFKRLIDISDAKKQLTEMKHHKKEQLNKSKKLLKDANPDLKHIVSIAKELVFFRTYRTDHVTQTFTNIRPLLQRIAKLRGCTFEDLTYMRINEIFDNRKVTDIKERKKHYALATLEPETTIFSSDLKEIDELIAQNCDEPAVESDVLKGNITYIGNVKGIVKVVNGKQDMHKMRKGDILVTSMTTPDMMTAMQKAAAFITDEGGITCHAAIISREMKIPCIVGTKVATKLLKDGDYVEIDATKGIVRKLNDYTVHFRNAQVPFVLVELFFGKDAYGAFDYIVLYKDTLAEGYLTEEGLAQAKKFGLQVNYDKIYKKLVAMLARVKKFKYTNLENLKQLIRDFAECYRYCEEPMLAGIEEILEKNCKNVNDCLQNPDKYKLPPEAKKALDTVTKLGQLKYELHAEIEMPIRALYEAIGHIPNAFNLTEKEIDEALSGKEVTGHENGIIINYGTVQFDYDHWKKIIPTKNELTGKCVSPGKVRGTVKIYIGAIDAEEIPKNSILVTGMTNPQLVPYLKDAKAIITDEGGLMCHAAIISRELGIPGIVGTQNGTQLLKDGDYVEVDADKGTIKLLEDEWMFIWGTKPVMPIYWTETEVVAEEYKLIPMCDIFSYFDGNVISTYMKRGQLKEKWYTYGEKYLDPKFYNNYCKEYEKEEKTWWKWIRKIEKKEYSSSKDLIKDFRKFADFQRDSIAYFGSTRLEFTNAVEEKLMSTIKKAFPDSWANVFNAFTIPEVDDDIQIEQKAWVKLLSSKHTDKDLLKHASTFPWLVYGNWSEKSVIVFLKKLVKQTNLKALDKEIKEQVVLKQETIKNRKKYEKQLGESDVKYLGKFLQEQSVRRMDQKSYWIGCYYLARRLFHKIAEVLKIDLWDIIFHITPQEILEFLEKPHPNINSLIEQRKVAYAITYSDKLGVHIITGDEATKKFHEYIDTNYNGIDELRGQTASPGKYTGKVHKVIASDIEALERGVREFKKGEILVTSMTQPNMMMIARRAKAIVTDEGGITSHAAIIARELGIPCVVGCEISMNVLHDGDLIEVDADNGIVKIAKKQNISKIFKGLFSLFGIQELAVKKVNDYAKQKLLLENVHFFKEGSLIAYVYMNDVARVRSFVLENLKTNKNYLDKLYKATVKKFETFSDRYKKFTEEINNIDNPNRLKSWIGDFVKFASDTNGSAFLVEIFAGYDDYWMEYLDLNKEDFDILMTPEEFSFSSEFTQELAKSKLKKSKKTPQEISSEFFWILNNYDVVDLVTAEYVSKELKNMSTLEATNIQEEANHYISDVLRQKEIVIKNTKLDKTKINFAKSLSSFIVLQDKRKEIISKTNSIFMKACDKLFDMYKIDNKQRKKILEAALPMWISELDLEELIIKTDEAYTCLCCPMEGEAIVGIDALNILNKIENRNIMDHNTSTVKGRSVFGGLVTGKVKRIIKNEDFSDFKDGDILVATMTSPEYVPAMKKAAAVITDEGGLTCHAAIVARELKTPCIIGTGNATKILKDGDLIEVDANNGVVKVLKKKVKIEFTEIFANSVPLIITELTVFGESIKDVPWSTEPFNFSPYCVFVRNNGIVHYLYDKKGIEWKKEHAGKFDSKEMIKKSLAGYNSVKNVIEQEITLGLKEFKSFVTKLKKAWTWWDCMWWMIEYYDENNLDSSSIMAIRKKTEYLAPGIMAVIRKSVRKILPEYKEYVDVLRLEEVLLKKPPSVETLKKRQDGYAFAKEKIFSSKEELEKSFNIQIPEDEHIKKDSLKGKMAYPGIKQGVVKIVKSRDDAKNLKKGEILVSPTTTPDYIEAMKRAGAIISEHGGIVSHASIISREIKKTCIVGVKGALKILKDGDLIVVDANNGTVKIIETLGESKYQRMWEAHAMGVFSGETVAFNISDDNEVKKKSGMNERNALFYYQKDIGTQFYNDIKEMKKSGKLGYDKFTDKSKADDYLKKAKKARDKADKIYDGLINSNFSSKNIDELLKTLDKLTNSFNEPYTYFHSCQPQYFTEIEKDIRSKISDDDFNTLTLPDKPDPLQLEHKEWMNIVSKAKSGKDVKKEIDAHSKKYIYLGTVEVSTPWDVNHYVKLLQKDIKKQFDEKTNKRKKTSGKIDAKIVEICNIISNVTVERMALRFAWTKTSFLYMKIIEEIANRKIHASLGKENIWQHTRSELGDALLNKKYISKDELAKRNIGFLFEIKNGFVEFTSGDEAINRKNSIAREEYENVSELAGVTACKGKVTGKVRLFTWLEEDLTAKMNDMKEGDILVAGQTRPFLMPAIRKAAAIVTDEGGITSHAAIISRELNIPCVIGTKNATKILKDGDIIEVDANNGVVKIIK